MTQLMSAMGLWVYPAIALVLFVLAFAAIMWRVFLPSRRDELAQAAGLPLHEAPAVPHDTNSRKPPVKPRVKEMLQ